MKIAIVGAGLTGLTAAYRLSQKGHRVVVFEKENYPGGLAAGFKEKNWHWSLENFFHHLFVSDDAAKKLISELGLLNKLFYLRPKTSIFYKEEISQFDSPASVLTFPHLSYPEKLRAGLVTASLKSTNGWKRLEKVTAIEWLKKYYGQKSYQILWKPLLEGKFGQETKRISMAWFWARIKKRSVKLGYLEGGFQVLINKLTEKIKNRQGEVLLNHEVKNFDGLDGQTKFDRIISTIPTLKFVKVAQNLTKEYKNKLKKLKMIGAINLVLILKQRFLKDGTYWLSVNQPGFPFVAVVEHTNFVDPQHYSGNHLVYVGGYYPQNHQYFKMTKKQIFKEFLPYLKQINPKLNRISNIEYRISKNLYAQPIIPTNYSKLIPSSKTPLPNVFLANMQMVYPWDRGINYAIKLGEKITKIIER